MKEIFKIIFKEANKLKQPKKYSEIFSLFLILTVFTLASFYTNFGLEPIVISSLLSGSFLIWINSEESIKLKEDFFLNSADSKNLFSINLITAIIVLFSLFSSSLPQSLTTILGREFSSSEEVINFFSIMNFSSWTLLVGNFLFVLSSFIYIFATNLFLGREISLGEVGHQLEKGLFLLFVLFFVTQVITIFVMVLERFLNG